MKNVLRMLFIVLAVASCGGIATTDYEPTSTTLTAPTFTRHLAHNTTINLPSRNTDFCHPIHMAGSGAHSQSQILQWGVPACGGLASMSTTGVSAIPNQCASPPRAGDMWTEVQCDKWTNFGGGGSISNAFSHSWSPTTTLQVVSAQTLLLGVNHACFTTGASQSATGEKTFLDVPNWTHWRMNTEGFRGGSGSSMCAWLGVHLDQKLWPVWLDTAVANPHDSGLPVDQGICLPYHVENLEGGGLDDGYWSMPRPNGTWTLTADNLRVKAYCIRY